jgi:hypothetical protein
MMLNLVAGRGTCSSSVDRDRNLADVVELTRTPAAEELAGVLAFSLRRT